eukprot:TRINITY_DN26342_c0_g1_i1.p1 TRINITY_DN26342_c0_g1~~TRINITY_DN26342_c0_g1_i1.p1  ORF type:complete len:805 (-),score=128.64 TRINITY_DN26342_c0_g1_i1:99-2513(-)
MTTNQGDEASPSWLSNVQPMSNEDATLFQQQRRGNQLRLMLGGTPRSGKSTLIRQFELLSAHDFPQASRVYARVVIQNNIMLCLRDMIQLAQEHGYTSGLSAKWGDWCGVLLDVSDHKCLSKRVGRMIFRVWKELSPRLDNKFADLLESKTLFSLDAMSCLLDHVLRIADPEYIPTVRDMMLMRHRDYLSESVADKVFSIGAADVEIRTPDTQGSEPVEAVLYLVSLADMDPARRTDSQLDEMVEVIKNECLQISRLPVASQAQFFLVFTKLDLLQACHTENQVKSMLGWRLDDIVASLEAERGTLFTHTAFSSTLCSFEMVELLSRIKAALALKLGAPLPVACEGLENIQLAIPINCGHCEKQQAMFDCRQCDCSFCHTCSDKVHQGRLLSHKLTEFSPLREHWPLPCEFHHGQKKSFISTVDAKMGCSHCFLAGGPLTGHGFSELNNVWDEVQAKYQYLFDQKPNIIHHINNTSKLVSDLSGLYDTATQEIEKQFDELERQLANKKAEQLEMLSLLCLYRRKQLEFETDEMQHALSLIQKDIANLPLISQGSHPELQPGDVTSFVSLEAVRSFLVSNQNTDGLDKKLKQLPCKLDTTQLQQALRGLELEADPPLKHQLEARKANLELTQHHSGSSAPELAATSADTEFKYYYQLQVAQGLDFGELEYLRVLRPCGTDRAGRQVVQVNGSVLDEENSKLLIPYMLHVLDEYVNHEYSIVIFNIKDLLANVELSAMRQCASLLPQKYQENLRRILIVGVTPRSSMALKILSWYPFISNEVWHSMLYVKDLEELSTHLDVKQLCV